MTDSALHAAPPRPTPPPRSGCATGSRPGRLAAARQLADGLRTAPPADALAALRTVGRVDRCSSATWPRSARCRPTCTPWRRCAPAASRPRSRSTGWPPSCARTGALYDVFAALDAAGLDAAAARLLDKTLEDFRRAGVDRDDATRARLTEINERLTELDQDFGRNIRDDVRTVRVPRRAAGRAARRTGSTPTRPTTTGWSRSPPTTPTRCRCGCSPTTRRCAATSRSRSSSRGWPQNEPLLDEMFALRHELADPRRLRRLGVLRRRREDDRDGPGDPGVHRPDRRRGRGADAARPRGAARALPPRRARTRPRSTRPTPATTRSWSARSSYDVDAQQVRTYFDFAKVRQGLLDVTGRLFGLRYEPVPDAPVWHEDVTAYDVHDADGRRAASAGSTSTCTRARASTSTPRSSRSPTASPAGSSPRACWSATSRAA